MEASPLNDCSINRQSMLLYAKLGVLAI